MASRNCERAVLTEMRRHLGAAVPSMEHDLKALNARQTLALYHLFKGRNVFLSGSAGTGKTFTTRLVVRFLLALKQKVALTATTGLAAANLEETGVGIVPRTLHSFAGIGLGEESAGELIKMLKTPKNVYVSAARNRWRDTSVLIVDEVSMLSPVFFTKLDKIARAVRNRPDDAFGGLTLLLVGDFHQLEPVLKGAEKFEADTMATSYCFQTQSWCDAIDVEVMLDQVYRQQDEQFVHLLQEVREGRAGTRSVQRLQNRTASRLRCDLDILAHSHFGGDRCTKLVELARQRYDQWSRGIDPNRQTEQDEDGDEDRLPTKRARTNKVRKEIDVVLEDDDDDDDDDDDEETERREGEEEEEGSDDAEDDEPIDWSRFDQYARSASRSTHFDETEALIRLLPTDLIDSAHQVYVSEVMPTRLMAVNRKVEEENRRQLAGIAEPIVSFDSRVSLNVSRQHSVYKKAFTDFETYFKKNILAPQRLNLKVGAQVMLLANVKPPALVNGRRGVVIAFRTLEEHDAATGVVRPIELAPPPSVKGRGAAAAGQKRKRCGLGELTQKEIDTIDKTPMPVVRFDNGVEARIDPYVWVRKKRFDKKQVKGQYLQVPLIAAFAFSIHKSQGLTISSLEIDLDEIFASGQIYVALSRATSLNGLILRSFDPAYVNGSRQPPNQSVIDYYNDVSAAQDQYYVL